MNKQELTLDIATGALKEIAAGKPLMVGERWYQWRANLALDAIRAESGEPAERREDD